MAMFLDGIQVSETAVRKALHSILADPRSENLDEQKQERLADQRVAHLLERRRRIPLLQLLNKMARTAGNPKALNDIVPAIMYAQMEGTFPSDEAFQETAMTLDASKDDVTLFYDYFNGFRT